MSRGLALLGSLLAVVAASACTPEWIDLANDTMPEAGVAPPVGGTGGSMSPPQDASMSMPPDASDPEADASTEPVARCGAAPCACDDGEDNDGDGYADGLDPECTGALDENEATFATGKPTKMKMCRDCFWDEDGGNGNDSCQYSQECLRGDPPGGSGRCRTCVVEQSCVDTCAARTPSGCDCFGCCAVARPGGVTIYIELSDRCSLDTIDDLEACPRCTQSSQCRNPCDRCELCPGRTIDDLPADCLENGATNRCDPAQQVCVTSADCTTDQYCQLGCCFTLLL